MPALESPERSAPNSLEEKYQSIFENAVTGIFQTSPDGRYLSANPALARLYGYDSPEELMANIFDIQHQLYVDRNSRLEFFRQMTANGIVNAFEAKVRTRDGREIWISESARAVTDAEGRVEYFEGTVKDITARKQAEEALHMANELLEQRVAERTAELEKSNEELRQALRERSTLAAAIDGAHFGVLISDPSQPDNPATYVNPAFERMSGYTEQEVIGRNCRFLQGPGTDQSQVQAMRQAIAERRPFNGLLLNYRKDKTPFWNDLAVNPVFNPQGELIAFVGLQNDVTERVKAQQALQESQSRYQRICENAPGMVYQFVLNGEGGVSFPFVSEGCRSLFGIAPEVLEQDASILLKMIHPEDASAFQASVEESAAALQPWEWQGRFIFTDGSERWMHARSRPERQPNGDVRWDGFVFEITDLHRAQQALRASEERKAAILEAALDGIVTTDGTGRILEVNPATEGIFGYRAAEMIGQDVGALLVPPHLREEYRKALREFVNADASQLLGRHLELPAIRADGATFPIEVAVTAIRADKHTVFTAHVRDITERREHEQNLRAAKDEAERANAAKSEFLSRMSHELRTPLNAILGFSQLLQRRQLDARQAESVGFIAKAGRHLLELVNEVLDLARIEAGRTSVSLEPVELREIMQESLDLVRLAAEERQIALAVETGPHFVCADRQRLKQVFVNLLSNAIKYNRPQGRVTVSSELAAKDQLAIRFQDTGPGISPQEMPRLFLPFERLGAENGPIEGAGIGLAISQRLVTLMDGEITVASEVGKGSTFTVSLPMSMAPARRAAQPHEPGRRESAHAQSTILYIEDNPANLRLMEELALEHPGVRLVTATQGTRALELARQWKPSLILLDLHLPDVPGAKLLKQFQAAEDLRDIPVIIVSADVLNRQVERLLEAGASDYLTKPIDVEKLLEIFDRHLSAKSP